MRLGAPGAERPALLDAEGRCFDLSGLTRDIDASFLKSQTFAQAVASAGARPTEHR
jgi:hypothetical protein